MMGVQNLARRWSAYCANPSKRCSSPPPPPCGARDDVSYAGDNREVPAGKLGPKPVAKTGATPIFAGSHDVRSTALTNVVARYADRMFPCASAPRRGRVHSQIKRMAKEFRPRILNQLRIFGVFLARRDRAPM